MNVSTGLHAFHGILARLGNALPYAADMAATIALGVLTVAAFVLLTRWARCRRDEPARIPERIPFVSNQWQYLTDNDAFLKRASKTLQHSHIATFYLGPAKVYLVSAGLFVQAMLRTPSSLSSDAFILMVQANVHDVPGEDIAKFRRDRSGRLSKPTAGFEHVPWSQRHWAAQHHVYREHLTRTEATERMAAVFGRQLDVVLRRQSTDEWSTIRLVHFLRSELIEAATTALFGTFLLERQPDMIGLLWEFDGVAMSLMYSLPRWMKPRPYRVRERVQRAMADYLEEAWVRFDWNGPDAEADWEPIFGARVTRELHRLYRDRGFTWKTQCALALGFLLGSQANTMINISWAMLHIVTDPTLLAAVRDEVATALVTSRSDTPRFDLVRLLALPLLQSIYTETLRLHVSINLTREVMETTELGAYRLPKGALVQAPTCYMHRNEATWARDGHGATDFWAERFVKTIETREGEGDAVSATREFTISGRPSDWCPYGGGVAVCPGRHFAKHQIMLAIAMLVSRFDMEFVEWTTVDGAKSDRPPQDNPAYMGSGGTPPDRDARIRWRKRW